MLRTAPGEEVRVTYTTIIRATLSQFTEDSILLYNFRDLNVIGIGIHVAIVT